MKRIQVLVPQYILFLKLNVLTCMSCVVLGQYCNRIVKCWGVVPTCRCLETRAVCWRNRQGTPCWTQDTCDLGAKSTITSVNVSLSVSHSFCLCPSLSLYPSPCFIPSLALSLTMNPSFSIFSIHVSLHLCLLLSLSQSVFTLSLCSICHYLCSISFFRHLLHFSLCLLCSISIFLVLLTLAYT